jgi:hypothetical protein
MPLPLTPWHASAHLSAPTHCAPYGARVQKGSQIVLALALALVSWLVGALPLAMLIGYCALGEGL